MTFQEGFVELADKVLPQDVQQDIPLSGPLLLICILSNYVLSLYEITVCYFMVLLSGVDAAAEEPSILPYSGYTDDDRSWEHSEETRS